MGTVATAAAAGNPLPPHAPFLTLHSSVYSSRKNVHENYPPVKLFGHSLMRREFNKRNY